ncbi:MAG: hypothetical protein J2P31_18490 [Blastocatellia bacterium]|nr:hypothetical protein [Blastocatellia bacterium]
MPNKSSMIDRSRTSVVNVILGSDRRYRRLVARLALMIAIIGLVYLSSASAQQKRQDTVAAPLQLRLILPVTEVCLDSKSITLEVEMKNTGNEPITVDEKFLWNGSISVDLRDENNEIVDGWLSGGGGDIPYTGKFIKIEPGDTNKVSYQLSLEEDGSLIEFFRRVGQYTMVLHYQAFDWDNHQTELRKWLYTKPVKSNQVEFHVVNCK